MEEAFRRLGEKDLYVEAWAEFEKELAVMVRQAPFARLLVFACMCVCVCVCALSRVRH